MKNVTLSADGDLIERARERARAEHSTLNEQFRLWLERYVGRRASADSFDSLMDRLDRARSGRRFTREEANER
jgi:hypothetical protein